MPAHSAAKFEHQHLRLLDGLAASIREKGLAQTHVSDIVGHARASRRTFYKHFADKDSCLIELVHLSATRIIEAVSATIDLDAARAAQTEQAIDAYLSILSSEPVLVLALSSPSVGERVIRAQREGLERFAEFLVALIAATTQSGASPASISLECAYMLTSGLRAAALRAMECAESLDNLRREAKALFNAALDRNA
ncbi:TetR/AcrR family transcriptional regulator [Mycolicibacterium mucogenicum]|uniref:TetR/AcrR family transcriptional regulator n=1 Tax=Mycolicibacterium mucogenicum TaxID=56689 RepID=UPI00226AC8A3|nr:TetR/AcrR family transcriptional regulator [Mycolicibacterium mucogenicum]MCX8563977.1 TetR/AcrR family transcriptional regulator [Mycolicibacterium mucogenicum]